MECRYEGCEEQATHHAIGYQGIDNVDSVYQMCEAHAFEVDHLARPIQKEKHMRINDSNKGLYGKYRIERADGSPVSGFKFVLSPEKDHAALEALKTYANATDNVLLAYDLKSWINNHEKKEEDPHENHVAANPDLYFKE